MLGLDLPFAEVGEFPNFKHLEAKGAQGEKSNKFERMAAEIWIGGRIPGRLAPKLCQEIGRAGVMDGNYNGFSPESLGDLLAAREVVGEHWSCT